MVPCRAKRSPILRWLVAAVVALALAGPAGLAFAEPDAEVSSEPIPLNQLLRLPADSGAAAQIDKRGGQTKPEWEKRFRAARKAQADAISDIARTRAAIEKKVLEEGGGQWRMGAPGLGNLEGGGDATESPLDYKLTQQLRRNREELARAERALQDLEVEANLASVPEEWRALPVVAATER